LPYLAEFLLFILPFAAFFLWQRFNPGREVAGAVVWLMLAGVGCGLAGAVWYARSVRLETGATYVPARLGPDGRIVPGGAEPRR
jgi:drug/metabolite transporter (DMT)-like permease